MASIVIKDCGGGNTLLRNSVGDEGGEWGVAQKGGCLRIIVLVLIQRPTN